MLNTETMLTLSQAAEHLPNRPSHVTLWRWCRKGLNGVQLEYRRVGRAIFTSTEALERFTAALAAADKWPEEPTTRQPKAKRCHASEKDMEWSKAVLGY